MSNTYRLEKEFGWTGKCVEPHPNTFKKLQKCRNVECINKAIYKKSNISLKFGDFGDSTLSRIDSNGQFIVETISWDDLLFDCPQEIDYISFDIEGLEGELLSEFPFDKYKVKFWTIEHNVYSTNSKNFNQCLNILLGQNYLLKTHDWDLFAILDIFQPEFYFNWKNIK